MHETSRALCGGILAAVLAAPAAARPQRVFRLDNGLRVVLHAAPGAEKAAVVLVYGIGEKHDPAGASGMAHLIEHCYVAAAAGDLPAMDVGSYVRRYPDGCNAQTGEDYTVIGAVVPSTRLAQELTEAATRMGHLRIEESDLELERPRMVAELANMYGGMPTLASANLARALARPSPPGTRKGGVEKQFAALDHTALQRRVDRFYKPRNAVLSVAGGFDVAATEKLIARLFGSLPAGDAVPESRAPAPVGERVREVEVAPPPSGAAVDSASLVFSAPAPGDPMFAPFVVWMAQFVERARKLGQRDPARACRAIWTPLDGPETVQVTIAATGVEDPAAYLRGLVASWTELRPNEVTAMVRRAESYYGVFLGLQPVPPAWLEQGNVYGVAFGHARRLLAGWDGAKLRKALLRVKVRDLRRCAEQVFGARSGAVAVVRVRR